jgi:hypothetical protein
MLGPVYEDDSGWRIRHNKELYELSDGPGIVQFFNLIKPRFWTLSIVTGYKNTTFREVQ